MDWKYLVCLVGMVMIIEGLPWAAAPSRYKRAMARILDEPDSLLRGLGFFAMAFGLFLVYLGRQG